MSSGWVDPYTDPVTGVMHNLVGATTPEALGVAESGLAAMRLAELARNYTIAATGDLTELQSIHRYLFQDVYPWAGHTRQVDIAKPGGEPFLPMSRIEMGAGHVFEQLRDDNYLTGLDRHGFVERLAHHYDQLNYVHPFREGNGRTQRVLWTRVAQDAGWDLDWRKVTPEQNVTASRIALENFDLGPLRKMFDTIASPVRVAPTTPTDLRERTDHVLRALEAFQTDAWAQDPIARNRPDDQPRHQPRQQGPSLH